VSCRKGKEDLKFQAGVTHNFVSQRRTNYRDNCLGVAVGGMEYAGARLAALEPSCIYRPRPPYF
jgi:hypothetical protein